MAIEQITPHHVALVHGYADFGQNPKRPDIPDYSSRLGILAVGELFLMERLAGVAFTTGSLSPDGESLAQVLGSHLNRILPKTAIEKTVIVDPHKGLASTRDEIRHFRELAEQNGWQDVLSIGKEAHAERIQRAIKRIFPAMMFIAAEDILRNPLIDKEGTLARIRKDLYVPYDSSPGILNKLGNSGIETSFKKREKLLNIIDSVPLIGGPMLDILNRSMWIKQLEEKLLHVLGKE